MNLYTQILTTNNELEECRLLFNSYTKSALCFEECFYDHYNIDYKIVFGDIDREIFLYNILKQYYRNDFFIRYSFIRKVLYNSKSISFEEYPIANSRIDIASINGKSVAYEIKSEYDNYSKLAKQIYDYSKCFEYVYVICPCKYVSRVKAHIPDFCGIYSFGDKALFSFKKELEASLSPNLNAKDMLLQLRKKELEAYFNNTDVDDINCSKTFEEINNIFKKALKKRFRQSWFSIKNRFKSL